MRELEAKRFDAPAPAAVSGLLTARRITYMAIFVKIILVGSTGLDQYRRSITGEQGAQRANFRSRLPTCSGIACAEAQAA
jgi:hypothetical protein